MYFTGDKETESVLQSPAVLQLEQIRFGLPV